MSEVTVAAIRIPRSHLPYSLTLSLPSCPILSFSAQMSFPFSTCSRSVFSPVLPACSLCYLLVLYLFPAPFFWPVSSMLSARSLPVPSLRSFSRSFLSALSPLLHPRCLVLLSRSLLRSLFVFSVAFPFILCLLRSLYNCSVFKLIIFTQSLIFILHYPVLVFVFPFSTMFFVFPFSTTFSSLSLFSTKLSALFSDT